MENETKKALKNMMEAVRYIANLFLLADHDFEEDVSYIQRQMLEAFVLLIAEMNREETDMSMKDATISLLYGIVYELSEI